MAKLYQKMIAVAASAALLASLLPAAGVSAAQQQKPVCTTADEWTALLDRRGQERTWLGADGIYTVALDGNDAYGSATADTKTFFIFSDSLMGTADAEGTVTWPAGQPSQTSAVLTGNVPDPDQIRFVWGPGGNGAFGADQHLFGRHMWMTDCFVVGDAIYTIGIHPDGDWKPTQMDMAKIPIKDGEPNYANYEVTENIPQLCHRNDTGSYIYMFGIGVTMNTESAHAPDPDGYIYIYGYRDDVRNLSRKDVIVARIAEKDFPDFSKMTYWDGETWGDDVEKSARIINNTSCLSVSPVTEGPAAGRYIAVYTTGTEGANLTYALGDTPYGPFDRPVNFYKTPEHASYGGMYTYNAKAHPHLSSDGKLLVSYDCNNRDTHGRQTTVEYHPRFVWLDLNTVGPVESGQDDPTSSDSSQDPGSSEDPSSSQTPSGSENPGSSQPSGGGQGAGTTQEPSSEAPAGNPSSTASAPSNGGSSVGTANPSGGVNANVGLWMAAILVAAAGMAAAILTKRAKKED